jgi:competence protein ComEA
MPSSPSPFVVEPAGWRARVERLLDGVARQRIAVAVLAVLALAAAGTLWMNAQPRAADPPSPHASGTGGAGLVLPRAEPAGDAGAGAGTAPGAGPAAGAGQPSGPTIAVDVVGRVQHPGLVRLPQGSRVLDAIEAAGGTTAGAELEAVNLARRLVDGEQLRIPRHGETVAAPPLGAPGSGGAPGGPGQPGGSGAPGAAGQPGVPLDLNTATAEQLDTLPGVGEVTANQIIAYRTAHPFRSVDDLRQVPGIGDRRFELLKDLVTVAGGS